WLTAELLGDNTRINNGGRARWRTPVVPAAREAEPAGSLEPRSSGLQCAMPSGRPR
uniref:Uncharacterized protein n=1 Tax=Cairina moschata TaxID=8855 RepID=A0A8C3CNP4_CAIMO